MSSTPSRALAATGLVRWRFTNVAGPLAFAAVLACSPARADVQFYNVFKVQDYTQTSTAAPTTPTSYQGVANVNASSAGDLTGGTVVVPGSSQSPFTLTGSGGNYAAGGGFATKAAMDAAFPNGGSYTFNLTGGALNGQSAKLSTPTSDAYSATVPYFTGSTYTALQGLNASTGINLTFNPYATPAGVNLPLTFIGISVASTGQLVFGTSGDNTLNSVFVPGGTLAAGTQYDLDIVYSARITTPGGFPNSTAFAAYDLRTDVIFTTAAAAVPEPSALALGAAAGSLLVGVSLWRRRQASRPVDVAVASA